MITTLMDNPKAGAIYANIDPGMPPARVADEYLQAKLAGDKDTCLAFEAHMRDLARVHFPPTCGTGKPWRKLSDTRPCASQVLAASAC